VLDPNVLSGVMTGSARRPAPENDPVSAEHHQQHHRGHHQHPAHIGQLHMAIDDIELFSWFYVIVITLIVTLTYLQIVITVTPYEHDMNHTPRKVGVGISVASVIDACFSPAIY
jgi:hypothetical protein